MPPLGTDTVNSCLGAAESAGQTEDPSSVPISTKIKMFKKDHFSFLLLRTLSKTKREACAQTAAMMEVRFATLSPLLLLLLQTVHYRRGGL